MKARQLSPKNMPVNKVQKCPNWLLVVICSLVAFVIGLSIGTVANVKSVKLENKDVYLGESFIIMRKDNSRTRETSFFNIEVSNADRTVQLETDEAANDTGSSLTIIPRVMAELLGLRSHPRFVLSFSSANGDFLIYLAEAQVNRLWWQLTSPVIQLPRGY